MPDYMYILESRLSPEQRAAMIRVQELAVETGSNVYLTGGAVRDMISGMIIHDLDFALEGNPLRLARELEKGGAQIVSHDERLRHIEIIFAGDVDGSISAARDEVYARPGTRPEIRWSTIMEDLHRRDFSLNAIAISLNPASRGLLLDPTNGLADLEKREVRALSIHSFTNQPVRLLRAIRYCARMDFELESRTKEWFDLALERQLQESIPPDAVGRELRQLGREDKPTSILKAWEARGLMATIHAQLARRHPDYETLGRILRARDDLTAAGLRPRMSAPVTYGALAKLKARERAAVLTRLEYRSSEADAVLHLEAQAAKVVKALGGKGTADPGAAFTFLESTPASLLAFVLAESGHSKVLGKVRNYLHKWRPLRQALPAAAQELEALGLAPGPKFDKAMKDFFHWQLLGKGRSPEDRVKLLRKVSGIKEPPKIKEEKKKVPEKTKKKTGEKEPASADTIVKGANADLRGKLGAREPHAPTPHSPADAKTPAVHEAQKRPHSAPRAKKPSGRAKH
jgi:tRNA nucleotidyltransferase (CCA-adding enzyme)